MTVAAAALLLIGTRPAYAEQQIGITAAVKGDVRLTSPDTQTERAAKSGGDVFFKERIQSGDDAALQLLLLDETTFTLGANADIVIDEMVYDPASAGDSHLAVSVASGVFRYISGNIGKENPQSVSILTPLVGVGIRGTSFFAVNRAGDGNWFFGLLGPGPRNNTGDAPGGIVVENELGSTEVLRAGYGVSVTPGEGPSAAMPIPPEIIQEFQAAVGQAADPTAGTPDKQDVATESSANETDATAQAQDEPAGDGDAVAEDFSASDVAGQDTADSIATVEIQQEAEATVTEINNQASEQTQSATATYDYRPYFYDDVRKFSGTGTYSKTNVPMYSGQFPTGGLNHLTIQEGLRSLTGTVIGDFDVSLTVNFDTRSINGSYSSIDVSSYGLSGETVPITHNYSANTGVFEENTTQNFTGPYEGEAMITFLLGLGGKKPDMLSGLAIQPDGTETDLVIGGTIMSPQ